MPFENLYDIVRLRQVNKVNWLDTLTYMRKQSGMSLDEVSEKSGVPKGTLSKITAGITKAPPLETMRSIVYAMGYTLQDLDDGIKSRNTLSKNEEEHIKKYRALDRHGKKLVELIIETEYERCTAKPVTALEFPVEKMEIPHQELKASAGTGFYLEDERSETWIVLLNKKTRRADFCVDIEGDSMEPMFFDGDTILVRSQPSIDVGQIGLYIMDGNGYVKRQGEGCLESLNPKYADIFPTEYAGIECKGLVLGKLEPEWICEI